MASPTIVLHPSPRLPQGSEHAREHTGLAIDARHGYCAKTVSSPTHAPCSHPTLQVTLQVTLPSRMEKQRNSRLAAKSMTGLHTLFATIRGRFNNPSSRPSHRPRSHSTSSLGRISSLQAGRRTPPGSVAAPREPSNYPPDVSPDLSALVPDYLDDPPAYSSPVRENQEVIDWQEYFDRTPIRTRTPSPYSHPAIQDVVSPPASPRDAWDRVAKRLSQ
jgi:hypothetical protein